MKRCMSLGLNDQATKKEGRKGKGARIIVVDKLRFFSSEPFAFFPLLCFLIGYLGKKEGRRPFLRQRCVEHPLGED